LNRSRRANAHAVLLILLAAAAALLIPALATASAGTPATVGSGGTGVEGTGGINATTAPPDAAQPADLPVQVSGNGITVATREDAMLGDGLRFTGTVSAGDAGDVVEIERLGRQTAWAWAPTAHGTVAPDGSFTAYWPANHIGSFQIRAIVEPSVGLAAEAIAASPPLAVTVYRAALATEYGPGFYGSQTACGQKLRRDTLGVANRTLRCGTEVSIYYRGRKIVVPVIDRGPYANNADWDLTIATARLLGVSNTTKVGAVSLPSQ
jgi:hypothetical protein